MIRKPQTKNEFQKSLMHIVYDHTMMHADWI